VQAAIALRVFGKPKSPTTISLLRFNRLEQAEKSTSIFQRLLSVFHNLPVQTAVQDRNIIISVLYENINEEEETTRNKKTATIIINRMLAECK
jgi:hypothetical protein